MLQEKNEGAHWGSMIVQGIDLPGWCSEEKAAWLTDRIRSRKPMKIVEIGVYGGASLIPMALEARKYGGRVFGIDPWDTTICLEGMAQETNKEWWSQYSELVAVKKQFIMARKKLGLLHTIKVYHTTSDKATHHFSSGTIDLLSIDGNHGPQAERDAVNWLPRMRKGGLIACDDLDWEEGGIGHVRRAVDWLQAHGCVLLDVVTNCAMLEVRQAV